jgi:hypothetical protein
MPFLPQSIAAPTEMAMALEHLVDLTSGPQTIALLVDRQGQTLTALQRAGAVPCDDLLELCTICTGDGDSDDEVGEVELLVMASWRPGTGAHPDDTDTRCWSAMLDRTCGTDVHLVDWLLVDGSSVTSMSTACGRQ